MQSTQDLLTRLAAFERWAEAFYRGAAEICRNEAETSMCLLELAEEETSHQEALRNALSALAGNELPLPPVVIGDSARLLVAQPVERVLEGLRGCGRFSSALADRIITLEFSEWNLLSLWVLGNLKERETFFRQAAVRLQRHLRQIRCFLERHPLSREQRERIDSLPSVWREKILVVDDDPDIRNILEIILQEEGLVETADDGHAGLEKVRENYYALIVSDIRMPRMDGLSFYREAAREFDTIGDRFLFFSSALDTEETSFLQERRIPLLRKPLPLSVIREEAQRILNRDLAPC